MIGTLDSAVYSAGQIRDRFSPDGWLALKDLSKTIHQFATTVAPGDDATRAMTVILRKLAGFSGLLHENMYRFAGWRFLEIGRRLERGIQIARTLSRLTSANAPDGALDMMLEIGDSVMTHRRRQYPVADQPAHGDRSPGARSAQSALHPVPAREAEGRDRPAAGAGRAGAHVAGGQGDPAAQPQIAIKEPSDMTPKALDALATEIGGLYNSLAKAYFRVSKYAKLSQGLGNRSAPNKKSSACSTISGFICTMTTRGGRGGRHQVPCAAIDHFGVQRVIAASLSFAPTPTERSDFLDFFGNNVTSIAFRDAHDALDIRMSARVSVARPEPGWTSRPT